MGGILRLIASICQPSCAKYSDSLTKRRDVQKDAKLFMTYIVVRT